MAKITVTTTKDYSIEILSPPVNLIDFSTSTNFATATFAGSQFDGIQIAAALHLRGKPGSYFDLNIEDISGVFDASAWTFSEWSGKAMIYFSGSASDDIIVGTHKRDVMAGGLGRNILDGGEGNDVISGFRTVGRFPSVVEDGVDVMAGGVGDDILSTQGLDDVIDGGTGADKLNFFGQAFGTAVTIDLTQVSSSFGQNSTVTNVETLVFWGGTGNDIAIGAAGDDELHGGEGDDELTGNDGDDYLDGGSGNDTLAGDEGNDFLAYYGNDLGADTIDGGGGIDLIVFGIFDTNAGSFVVDIRNGGGGANIGNGTTLTGIERVFATFGDGNDHFRAAGQDDSVNGGSGNDLLSGGGGYDQLYGEDGNDTIIGGRGGDFLSGDVFMADEGIDTVSYVGSTAGVLVDLRSNAVSGGDAEGDTIGGFENIFGSSHADRLDGDDLANVINGLDGSDELNGWDSADTLFGGAGADTLAGGLGSDRLLGGAEGDIFVFNEVDESAPDSERDMVLDFVKGMDMIDLSAIDAVQPNGLPDDTFNFIGRSQFTAAGDLRYVMTLAQTIIYGDVDGDGSADFSIGLKGRYVLTESDFAL